jgi:hypothetical protein
VAGPTGLLIAVEEVSGPLLSPHEQEGLLLHVAGLAHQRRDRGLRLN